MQKNIYVGAEASLLTGSKYNDIAFKNALPDEIEGFMEDSKYVGLGARVGMTYHFLPVLNAVCPLTFPPSWA
ncbi:MAG: hypothetical protein U5N26_03715 [Candidatus Marinimicrobia bacterium]|nr:hypothetical protein [Candidatus Neomarinimicrobiota bacterium]